MKQINNLDKTRTKLKLASAFVLLALCTSAVNAQEEKKRKKKSSEAPPVTVVELETQQRPIQVPQLPPERPANGSLFANNTLFSNNTGGPSLFSDFKARSVDDLIFINVVEETTATVESNAERSRDSGTLGGIGTVAGPLPIPGAAVAGTIAGALGRRTYEGNGSTDRRSNLQARITARVVEVLPNGDLRIEALKQVKINREVEQLALSGIVRTSDVATDNSIPTTFIGDLRVELNGKGIASKDNAPGWLFRLFEKVTPF